MPFRSSKIKPKPKASKAVNQVRIIRGRYKRTQIAFIDAEGLRPTPDRLRETLFNWLAADLYDAVVLDACAGSGVLGFEALSSGAAFALFIEANSKQTLALANTATQLKLNQDSYRIICGKAEQIISTLTQVPSKVFNIVFIDPPYALNLPPISLCSLIITTLFENKLINNKTLIYIEDNQPIALTLQTCKIDYTLVKTTQVGQVHGSLIQLCNI